jgi:hypothetical protein
LLLLFVVREPKRIDGAGVGKRRAPCFKVTETIVAVPWRWLMCAMAWLLSCSPPCDSQFYLTKKPSTWPTDADRKWDFVASALGFGGFLASSSCRGYSDRSDASPAEGLFA